MLSWSSAGVPRMAIRGHCIVLGTWLLLCLCLCCALCFLLYIVCPLPSCHLIIVSVAPPVSPSLPPRLSPYLFSRCLQSCADTLFYIMCCVCLYCSSLPACFPPRCVFCFFLLLKERPFFLQLEFSPHLSSCTLTYIYSKKYLKYYLIAFNKLDLLVRDALIYNF